MMFLRGALYVIFFVSASAFTTLPTTPMAVVRPRSLCASADALTRVKASTSNRGDHAIRGVLLPPKPFQAVRALVTSGLLAACLVLLSHPLPATAADGARVVGEFQGSGLVFKDTLKVESFDDPKIKGVTLYISNFERPLTERLSSNFFADPSDASVGCARTGPVAVADNIARGSKVRYGLSFCMGKHCTASW